MQKKRDINLFEELKTNHKQNDINTIIDKFQNNNISNTDRYTSFDYCYNYFRQPSKEILADMEKSCLVIGFYLASWGMLRGSSFLLNKSVKYYEPLVCYIAKTDKSVWDIDVDNYTDENIDKILKIYDDIKNDIIDGNNAHLTLVTKIMLGVFGIIPAFDSYFCKSFREIFNGECGFRAVNKESLKCINEFYNDNKEDIDKASSKIFVREFNNFEKTTFNYTKAKIIDMYGFTRSLKN